VALTLVLRESTQRPTMTAQAPVLPPVTFPKLSLVTIDDVFPDRPDRA